MTLGVSVKSLCELLFRFADFEPRDAEALFDYSARSSKELSFRKGDIIRVFKRFNTDWWDGTINGSDGFVPAKYIRIPNDDNDPDITDGEGNTSPGELPPFPGGDRPRDLNVPPRIPKREGSLRGRDSLPSPTELASPTGHSPQSGGMSSFKKQTPITSTPTSSSGGSPAISSEDIVKRQLTLLRKAPREEKDSESSVDKTPDKEQSSFNMPRLRSISPTRKSSWPSRGGEDDRKTGDTPGGAGNVTKEEHQRSSEVIWQPRGESPGNKTPPGSPQTSTAPKIPPAVRPKPKGNRNPAPPFRKNSDDLLASLQAAQVVRGNRGSSAGEDTRKSRGSVGDDTAF